MRRFHFFIFVALLLFACSQTETQTTYWKLENGDSTLRQSCQVQGELLHGTCKRYYKNGQLMSVATYKDDKLENVLQCYDTLGGLLYHGNVKNGNGFAMCYSDKYGTPETSGNYVDGEREGWWRRYNYRGDFLDSIFYTRSRPEFFEDLRVVMY